jgi:dTDP-4-amino-4,6-dideoxygalactose transaminase
LNIHQAYTELKNDINLAIARVMDSGQYILGPEVEKFEVNFASFCDANYAIGLSDGLSAIHLGLKAMGIQSGDEVIVPSNTFIATWLAVTECGAIPVPVEPSLENFNLNPELIEKAITKRTKAIIPVHLYGHPADLDKIIEIAKKYNLWVLEDAAQAHGAIYKGKKIGAHGNAVAWSFYPGKNLGAYGDGGAVTTDDEILAEKIRELRNYGSKTKYLHSSLGFNKRLDPLQAAILDIKLKHLNRWNLHRTKIASRYKTNLTDCDVILPKVSKDVNPVWHLFVIRCEKRDLIQKFLTEKGIETLIHYPIPPHNQKAYALPCKLPIAEQLSREVLSLPIGPHMPLDDVDFVSSNIKNIF